MQLGEFVRRQPRSLGQYLERRARGLYFTVSTKLSRLFNLMGSTPPAAAAANR
jgi:hypothetical protein